jgi:biotin carboxyl carrier protein
VEAPRSGRIKEITVTEGQTVQEGDTLAVLE